jgi:tRNA-splicing ligase RtcB
MKTIHRHKKEPLRIPIHDWGKDTDLGALSQAVNITKLPFAKYHMSLMADRHQGYGMPIGGVAAFDNVVIPNAVGVDISCSMTAVRTALKHLTQEEVKATLGEIRKLIPVGPKHHKTPQQWNGFYRAPNLEIIEENIDSARKQLGTLGGGNHFIEIQKGSDGRIWFMIHSGSRNIGYKVAAHYHKIAIEFCKQWHSNIPHKDLSFLPVTSRQGKEYIKAMQFMMDFAEESHRQMMLNVRVAFDIALKTHVEIDKQYYVRHNYAALENHYGQNFWVHRKGAIKARPGDVGIIPGSQGRKSYIVEGNSTRDAFYSLPHGAGRRMGRGQAKRELDYEAEVKSLEDQGIVHTLRGQQNLDEADGSYKQIKTVINAHRRMMKVLVNLTPLGSIKDPSTRDKRWKRKQDDS